MMIGTIYDEITFESKKIDVNLFFDELFREIDYETFIDKINSGFYEGIFEEYLNKYYGKLYKINLEDKIKMEKYFEGLKKQSKNEKYLLMKEDEVQAILGE